MNNVKECHNCGNKKSNGQCNYYQECVISDNDPIPSHWIEKHENVSHPNHYNREGGIECIEEMEQVFGTASLMTFCLMNVWKYRYRAADKNGIEDLKKSDFYMKKYIELRDKQHPVETTEQN